jgi:aerobic carbon-monoxide dehydrogenase medium subunit
VKPAPFSYVRAPSLDEALARLDADEGAKILAGGQSLMPLLNMRLLRPTTLVDINGVPGLNTVDATPDGGLRLGALVRQTDLLASPIVRTRVPLLAAATRHVGHRAIRNRGTIGGSLAHADPAAELPAAALALDATLIVSGPGGRRRIAARDFFTGPLTTALEPREILIEIEIAGPVAAAWGFAEVARRAGDFAIAGVAAVLRPAPGDPSRCATAHLVAFGCGDTPVRLGGAEAALAGARIDPGTASAAADVAAQNCTPRDDLHASADYRRHLVAVLTEQVVLEAAARLGT